MQINLSHRCIDSFPFVLFSLAEKYAQTCRIMIKNAKISIIENRSDVKEKPV